MIIIRLQLICMDYMIIIHTIAVNDLHCIDSP